MQQLQLDVIRTDMKALRKFVDDSENGDVLLRDIMPSPGELSVAVAALCPKEAELEEKR